MLKFLGNILWLIFGGVINFLAWTFVGLLYCITIIGIPIGLQCFKIAGLALWPMNKEVYFSQSGVSFLVNIIWLIFGGIEIAAVMFLIGLIYCATIIGIPFGLQQFKMAKLALMPFGARVYDQRQRQSFYTGTPFQSS